MMKLLVLAAVLTTAIAGSAMAGQQPAAPGRPQPAIDPLSASIQGRVTTESGAPIRRAEVRAISTGSVSRLTMTDGDGRFDLRDMPAGQFRLSVSKSGFITLTYGQRRPFEAASPIDLKEGQRVTVNVALPRGGAVTGRVVDESGEPIAGVRVQALRLRTTEGRRRLEPAGPVDLTDDTGTYRLYGLPPADYYISASPPRREIALPAGVDLARPSPPREIVSAVTTFYPGTPSLEEAQRVTLGASAESRADIQILQGRTATVSGMVLNSSGSPAPDATVSLRSEVIAMGVSAVAAGTLPLSITGHTEADGTFALPGVPPGPYSLQAVIQDLSAVEAMRDMVLAAERAANARQAMPPMQMPLPEVAVMPVVVTSADLTGLTLAASRGGTAQGTFVADAGVTRPLPSRLEINARPLTEGAARMVMTGGSSTFQVRSNGLAYLVVTGLPDDWMVKAIVVDGVDMIDQPVDFRRDMNVRVILTDRVPILSGRVTDGTAREGEERINRNVVVFPEDSKKWASPSRYLRTVRTDATGAFTISGLPPDERYLAVAVDFLEDGEGADPEFLERAKTGATTFSLSEGERKSVELRLTRR